jgi:hypothetical protein
VELPLDVNAQLVEIGHVVLRGRAVSWKQQRDSPFTPLTHSCPSRAFDLARFYVPLHEKLREDSFENSTGAWHVANASSVLSRVRARPLARVRTRAYTGQKSKEYYFKTRYGVKA